MKKVLSLLAVGAFAFTACTSDEVIDESFAQTNAIGFESTVNKNSRAINAKADLNTFYAYAYYITEGQEANPISVFDGETVSLNGTTWGYTNTRYWVPGGKYYFYAYSCENRAITSSNGTPSMDLEATDKSGRALKINDFLCNNTHQHDLLFASNDGGIDGNEKADGNAKVGFTFKHILTKVNVVFSSGFAPGYEIEVSNVSIRNIRDKGSYNSKATTPWGTPVRVLNENDEDYVPFINLSVPAENIAAVANGEVAAKTVTTGAGFVIPFAYTGADVRLQFQVNVKNENGESILNRVLTGSWKPNWVIGTAYTYNVKITGTTTDLDPIVFETSENMNLDDWTTGDTDTVDMTFSAN